VLQRPYPKLLGDGSLGGPQEGALGKIGFRNLSRLHSLGRAQDAFH
jgi:hypothetical protein